MRHCDGQRSEMKPPGPQGTDLSSCMRSPIVLEAPGAAGGRAVSTPEAGRQSARASCFPSPNPGVSGLSIRPREKSRCLERQRFAVAALCRPFKSQAGTLRYGLPANRRLHRDASSVSIAFRPVRNGWVYSLPLSAVLSPLSSPARCDAARISPSLPCRMVGRPRRCAA